MTGLCAEITGPRCWLSGLWRRSSFPAGQWRQIHVDQQLYALARSISRSSARHAA